MRCFEYLSEGAGLISEAGAYNSHCQSTFAAKLVILNIHVQALSHFLLPPAKNAFCPETVSPSLASVEPQIRTEYMVGFDRFTCLKKRDIVTDA